MEKVLPAVISLLKNNFHLSEKRKFRIEIFFFLLKTFAIEMDKSLKIYKYDYTDS